MHRNYIIVLIIHFEWTYDKYVLYVLYHIDTDLFVGFCSSLKDAECTSTQLELSMALAIVVDTTTSKPNHNGWLG